MDEARNMALLFFVDHLMLKGGQRTIHDLSCQFGARGFTEEMRHAVGTTQEGLTEFLGQFPSLFVLEGEQVILKGFGEVEGKNHLMHIPATGRQRDYAAEAVQFFVKKLEKFGPELQIKSLLGHRSQAAPEVRLVSGRHLKEFADFLAAQTEHFVVEGDRVRLANMAEPNSLSDDLLDEEGRPLAGHRAKLAAIEFMKQLLEENEEQPYPLDQFYKKFCEYFPHHIRQEVATNPKELLLFLKLNRHLFFIRSNKVQLVRHRPPTACSEDPTDNSSPPESGRSTEEASVVVAAAPRGGAGSGGEEQQHQQQHQQQQKCGGRSSSSLLASAENGANAAAAVAANCLNSNSNSSSPSLTIPTQFQPIMFALSRDNLHFVQVVKTLKQAQEVVGALKADLENAASSIETTPAFGTLSNFLAIDFKLVSLGGGSGGHPSEQFVALVVVATPLAAKKQQQQQLGQLIVFDLAHCEGILTDSGLGALLESDRVLKVAHDVRKVATLLAQRYGLRLRKVFDTQIAHSVIQHHKFAKPMGELRAISFVNLQRVYSPQSLVLSDISPRKLSQTPNWADRPVSADVLLSACEECHCLADSLYRLLQTQLPQQLLPLFEQLVADALTPYNGKGSAVAAESLAMALRNGGIVAVGGVGGMQRQQQNGCGGSTMMPGSLLQRRAGPQPLMEVPLNGIYRPPGIRRGSCQPQQQLHSPLSGTSGGTFGNGPLSPGGYIPPPLRKGSAPLAPPLLLGQCRSPTIMRNNVGVFSGWAIQQQLERQQQVGRVGMCDAQTQTISTGEIAVLKVYYEGEEEKGNKVNGRNYDDSTAKDAAKEVEPTNGEERKGEEVKSLPEEFGEGVKDGEEEEDVKKLPKVMLQGEHAEEKGLQQLSANVTGGIMS